MARFLISWSVNNPLIVILMALCLAAAGLYAFFNVNVEAYPDPSPAVVEVVAQYPGASAEEVERLVTIPLEVQLAGMPGLTHTRSKSLAGLAHLRNQFSYGTDYYKTRQEVLNRLATISGLPSGVTPVVSPYNSIGELIRFTLSNPLDADGKPIYSLSDLKSLQDYTIYRILRRVPNVIDISSFGGTVKRYEIHPDPDRMKRYGITLAQLQNAIGNANTNVGGDILFKEPTTLNVRGINLFGGGADPMQAPEVTGALRLELDAHLAREKDLTRAQKERWTVAFFNGGREKPSLTEEEKRKVDDPQVRTGSVHNLAGRLTDEEKTRLRKIGENVEVRAAIRARDYLRQEEMRRVLDIRRIVVTANNNHPVRVADLVEGGPLESETGAEADSATPVFDERLGKQGVVIGHQTRLGRVSRQLVPDKDLPGEEDKVMGVVLLRKNEPMLATTEAARAKIDELNTLPGRLLPGVQLQIHWDVSHLLHVTTDTVRENLFLGMTFVTIVLLMFLSNVRSALIVAINVPLALLFAFGILFLRGKSANLLSIGAVDFGIIVDSSVIMVENIYRHISAGENPHLPLKERIIRASHEVEHALLFSTAIMICAFLPLFTMSGPEGQIFGPMAETYAFALGGGLLLAVTLAPVMCLLLFKHLKPAPDNFLVRFLKSGYLRNLKFCLHHRYATLIVIGSLMLGTMAMLPLLGREFLPALEEGNIYVRGTFPVDVSLEEVASKARIGQKVMIAFPEAVLIQSQVGRPDDGTDPSSFYNTEYHVPLRPQDEWPKVRERGTRVKEYEARGGQFFLFKGWYGLLDGFDRLINGPTRARTKDELIEDMKAELSRYVPGVDWNFSQYIRDNVTEVLSGVKGDNSLKIFGPDLTELERLAAEAKAIMQSIPGMKDVGIFHIKGQPNLEIRADPRKCALYGVSTADVQGVISAAVGGKAFSTMVEGEKTFDITLRFPPRLRNNEEAIKHLPIDIVNNSVAGSMSPQWGSTFRSGGSFGVSAVGSTTALPTPVGSQYGGSFNNVASTPRRSLQTLITPLDEFGRPDPHGSFIRLGASTIAREQGQRMIALKFSVRGRDLAGTVGEAQEKISRLINAPYRVEWAGEFEEMEDAERRLMIIIPISVVLVCVLLYLAFRSLLDAAVVLSNVLELSMGGVWLLLLTGTNFSISAAVGFISIFGVAIMDGLLLISYFNHLRAEGLPLEEAILQGAEKRVRPVMMTALTAIFGLLPAAMSTRIGSQAQQPLAIVVVGGMIATLFITRYLMPVLYTFYGHREPIKGSGGMAH
jgi:cobalt-zinc-cadmium resistance protein CzcA